MRQLSPFETSNTWKVSSVKVRTNNKTTNKKNKKIGIKTWDKKKENTKNSLTFIHYSPTD